MTLYRNKSNWAVARPLPRLHNDTYSVSATGDAEVPVAVLIHFGEYRDVSPAPPAGYMLGTVATWDDVTATVVMDVVPVPVQSLIDLKKRKWEEIKAERDRRKSGGVLVAGKWFHSDTESRIQIIALTIMGPALPAVEWKTMDGSFVTMTPSLAAGVFQTIAGGDIADFANAENHRLAMEASDHPADYDYSTGWRAIYEPVA